MSVIRSQRRANVLWWYGEGFEMHEIARLVDMDKSSVHAIIKRHLKKNKRVFTPKLGDDYVKIRMKQKERIIL